ncbi:MAG TPA: hypothetical protein PLV25_00370 [Opitutales bacterium]|nr:hypothetical protein [Opitutales bacterium]
MKIPTLVRWGIALGLSHCLFADTAVQTTTTPTLLPNLPEVTSRQLNASFSGGWLDSGDFDGWGGAIRIGMLMNVHHGLEFEVNYFHLTNNANPSTLQATSLPDISDQFILSARNVINEVPLFVNYRYQYNLKDYPLGFYAGGGIGVNIASLELTGSVQENVINDNVVTPGGTVSINKNSTKVNPAGQLFIGVGGRLSENIGIYIGGRMLATQKLKFVDSTGTFGTIANTDSLQGIAELTLLFTW